MTVNPATREELASRWLRADVPLNSYTNVSRQELPTFKRKHCFDGFKVVLETVALVIILPGYVILASTMVGVAVGLMVFLLGWMLSSLTAPFSASIGETAFSMAVALALLAGIVVAFCTAINVVRDMLPPRRTSQRNMVRASSYCSGGAGMGGMNLGERDYNGP
jgi:hypothetical protein